jgi:hypothetical protein
MCFYLKTNISPSAIQIYKSIKDCKYVPVAHLAKEVHLHLSP